MCFQISNNFKKPLQIFKIGWSLIFFPNDTFQSYGPFQKYYFSSSAASTNLDLFDTRQQFLSFLGKRWRKALPGIYSTYLCYQWCAPWRTGLCIVYTRFWKIGVSEAASDPSINPHPLCVDVDKPKSVFILKEYACVCTAFGWKEATPSRCQPLSTCWLDSSSTTWHIPPFPYTCCPITLWRVATRRSVLEQVCAHMLLHITVLIPLKVITTSHLQNECQAGEWVQLLAVPSLL